MKSFTALVTLAFAAVSIASPTPGGTLVERQLSGLLPTNLIPSLLCINLTALPALPLPDISSLPLPISCTAPQVCTPLGLSLPLPGIPALPIGVSVTSTFILIVMDRMTYYFHRCASKIPVTAEIEPSSFTAKPPPPFLQALCISVFRTLEHFN